MPRLEPRRWARLVASPWRVADQTSRTLSLPLDVTYR